MERQSKSLMYRFIFIAALLLLASWQLYPTFNLSKLNQKQQENFTRVEQIATVGPRDIKDALLEGTLESTILKSLKDSTNEHEGRELARRIVDLDDKISKNERGAIKRGLDLQGGTYLVYEVDFVNYLSNPNVAKNPDRQLQQLLEEIDYQAKHQDLDFFEVLPSKFEEKGIPLSRYFGKKGESDGKIISNLQEESENAIDRALQVLRNRIDQFGVSEPSITKQGKRRIVVELAGILDVNRAKDVIGKTAQLEFKLLKDAEYTRSLLFKIDDVVKKRRYGKLDSTALAEVTASDTTENDSTKIKEKMRQDEEVNLDELFGTTSETEKRGEGDTSISVDKEMFEDHRWEMSGI
jgi:SecD/SecF fusion protein